MSAGTMAGSFQGGKGFTVASRHGQAIVCEFAPDEKTLPMAGPTRLPHLAASAAAPSHLVAQADEAAFRTPALETLS
jgi:hypothetical protein